MLTGDNMASAGRAAEIVGIDNLRSDLLPEDKLDILEGYLSMREGKGSLVYVGTASTTCLPSRWRMWAWPWAALVPTAQWKLPTWS
jgi:hypothetical protein